MSFVRGRGTSIKLVDLETLQVIVKSNRQHTSLDETMESSQPEFYANASLLSQVFLLQT